MAVEFLKSMLVTLIASVILILLGLVYFMINLWIVTFGSKFLGYATVTADWAVLAAALLTFGGVLASAIEAKK